MKKVVYIKMISLYNKWKTGIDSPLLRFDFFPSGHRTSCSADIVDTIVDPFRPIVHWINSRCHLVTIDRTRSCVSQRLRATNFCN